MITCVICRMCEKETRARHLSGDVCALCELAGEVELLKRNAQQARHPTRLFSPTPKPIRMFPINAKFSSSTAGYYEYWALAEQLLAEPKPDRVMLRRVRDARGEIWMSDDVNDRLLSRHLRTLVRVDEDGREVLDARQYARFVAIHHALSGFLPGEETSSGGRIFPEIYVRLVTAALNGDVDPDLDVPDAIALASGERALAFADGMLFLPEERQVKRSMAAFARPSKSAGAEARLERSTTATQITNTFRPSRPGLLIVTTARIRFFASRDLPPIKIVELDIVSRHDERVVDVRHHSSGAESPVRFDLTFGLAPAALLVEAAIRHARRAAQAATPESPPGEADATGGSAE